MCNTLYAFGRSCDTVTIPVCFHQINEIAFILKWTASSGSMKESGGGEVNFPLPIAIPTKLMSPLAGTGNTKIVNSGFPVGGRGCRHEDSAKLDLFRGSPPCP